MDILNNLMLGFSAIMTFEILMYAVIGCALGMMTGVLPGFGPAAATALLLPLAFVVSPTASIVMIAAIYYGSMYGGTITSILLNVPGEVSSVATCLDGYAMTKKGRAGTALSIAAVGSFFGGMVAMVGMLFATQFSELALALGPAELFALSVLALGMVVGLAGKSVIKGCVSAALGLFVGAVGLDPVSGAPRFTMGSLELRDGIEFVAVIMGLFGLSEILESIGRRVVVDFSGNIGSVRLRWQDIRDSAGAMVRGTGIGFFFGLMPSATMAILLGAFTINGLQPGPLLFAQNPEVAWGLIASLIVSNVILLIMALPLVRFWVMFLRIPTLTLYAVTLGFMSLGAFTIANSTFNIWVMWIAGLIGVILKRLDVPLAPAALTLVLGPLLEDNFRRALSIHHGDFSGLVSSPLSIGAYAVIVITLVIKMTGVAKGGVVKRALVSSPSGRARKK